jgi:hypothetical protein
LGFDKSKTQFPFLFFIFCFLFFFFSFSCLHPWVYFVHPAMRIDSFAPWLIDLLTATIEVDPCNCFISPLFQLCFFSSLQSKRETVCEISTVARVRRSTGWEQASWVDDGGGWKFADGRNEKRHGAGRRAGRRGGCGSDGMLR